MGEHSIIEIADALNAGLAIEDLTFIDGTVYRAASLEHVYDAVTLPSFPAMQDDKLEYARSFAVQYENSDPFTGKRLVEPYSDHEFVVQNPPAAPLTQSEMDAVYRLPYARTYHPMYEAAGGVPAISEVKFSLTTTRWWTRRGPSSRSPTSRATSTTWAAPRRTSARPPAPSS